MIDITPLLLVCIIAIGSFVTVTVVPLIKSKTSKEQQEYLYNWVTIGCEAAEQLVKNGTIQKEDRKNHVLDFLKSQGITYNQKQVNEMIESVVHGLPPLLKSNDTGEEDDGDSTSFKI